MIIKPETSEIIRIDSMAILNGLSCRFKIALPQSQLIRLHTYKTDIYQGLRQGIPSHIPHLIIHLKNLDGILWDEWSRIPLGYSPSLTIGYIDLMAYLGVNTLNLATVDIGLSTIGLTQGLDTIAVLVSLLNNESSSSIPDDFLPF